METGSKYWSWAGIALLAATTVILMAAPVFPSQDGPVHLYYVDVLRGLLTHSGPYARHFEIKSLLTPYALEYFALLALEAVFSAPAAEKVLLVCYIFAFGLGFRYLVESVADRRSPWSLAAIPFCMNALIYLGFLNYSFAVALLLLLCGFWIRHSRQLQAGRVACLIGGLVLMLVTHPVPVLVFLLFCGLYFAADVLGDAGSWTSAIRSRTRPLAVLLLMGVMALAWLALFVDRSPSGPTEPSFAQTFGLYFAIATELQLYPVSPIHPLHYRAALLLVGGVAVMAMANGSWKDAGRPRPAAFALLAASAICFVLYGIVPQRINGSWYFPDRFPILFLLFLLAAGAACHPPRRWGEIAGGTAVCATVAVLWMQWGLVARIGREIAPALESPPANAGSAGLILGTWDAVPPGLEFDPYFWSGAHYFRRSQAILLNAPWMNLPILLIRPLHPSRWNSLDPPSAALAFTTGIARGGTAPELDFLVGERAPDSDIERALAGHGWIRAPGGGDLLRIYRRGPARFTQ